MKALTIEDLRALIRLIPAARALQEELDKSIHLETFDGTGELALHSFQGLQQSIYTITEDPYLMALTISVNDNTTEKQVIAQVVLASSQLIAYLEGQAGVVGLAGRQNYSVQTAPNITLNMDSFQGGVSEMDSIMRTIDRAVSFRPPAPPTPPTPPRFPPAPPAPPRPPRSPFNRRDDSDDEDDH